MKKDVVADTSFYICHACNLKRTDLLCKYLDLYQFHYGPIIREEIPTLGKNDNYIRGKIALNEANYTELFKPLSQRDESHIDEDGEYEAIGIAIELSLTNRLGYLILDDKSPKNFAKDVITQKFPELQGKIVGTLGFIRDCYKIDSLITKNECINNLKVIYNAYREYKRKKETQRPCAMDEKVEILLRDLISRLETSNE